MTTVSDDTRQLKTGPATRADDSSAARPPAARPHAWTLGVSPSRVLAAAAVTVLLVAALAALLASQGWWQPWVAFPSSALAAAGAWKLCGSVAWERTPPRVAGALLLVSVTATVWYGSTHAEDVIVHRDSSSYFQTALELATNHATPIHVDPDDLGGPEVLDVPGVTLSSPAFYERGDSESPTIEPQFLIGSTSWFSIGYWLAGATGMWWMSAVFGGLACMTVGVLCSRLVGEWWGVLAAATTAVCFPLVHVARSTFSEPVALFVLSAGLLVLAEATRAAVDDKTVASRLAFVSGLLVGGSALIRLDALRETMLLIIVAGLFLATGKDVGRHLLRGAAVATIVALVVWRSENLIYVVMHVTSLLPLLVLIAAVSGLVALVVALSRRGKLARLRAVPWLPQVAMLGVFASAGLLASRPLWMTSHAGKDLFIVPIAQRAQGLPIDGSRQYAENTLGWMSWWVGPTAVAVAFVVSAVLARRLVAAVQAGGPLPPWTAPFLIGLGSSVLVWLRPAVSPDHPWADRRLTLALPFVIVCTVAAIAWSSGRLRARSRILARGVALAGALVLIVPTAAASAHHVGGGVSRGEYSATSRVCQSFRPGDVAIGVDTGGSYFWPQVLRGMCGVPALAIDRELLGEPREVRRVVADVNTLLGGRHSLVLVAADAREHLHSRAPRGAGITPQQVLDFTAPSDLVLLTERPDGTVISTERLWIARLR
jgi:hypothetical protein